MEEKTISTAVMSYVGISLADFFTSVAPFLGLAIVLILMDTRFGTLASRKRGEDIRFSRQWRRAFNKMVDYTCWVLLAGMFGDIFGRVIGIPTLSLLLLFMIYSIELSSVINNFFEYKGINKRFNLFSFIGRNRFTEAIEDKKVEKKKVKNLNDIEVVIEEVKPFKKKRKKTSVKNEDTL